ncbi:MAG: DUF523 domain-containing protein [Candidatus Izemoplasmatales bacterium]
MPSEIQSDGRIINQDLEDVSDFFNLGKTLSLEKLNHNLVKKVILKDGSPSCGYKTIYDGSFTNTKIKGQGVTTKHLLSNQIEVIEID